MTNDTESKDPKEPEPVHLITRLNYFDECNEERIHLSEERHYQDTIDKLFKDYSEENDEKVNADYLTAFLEQDHISEQGFERIVQAMVNQLVDSDCNTQMFLNKYHKIIIEFADITAIPRDNILCTVVKVLEPLLSLHLPKNNMHANYEFDWTKHRNTCIVLICMFDYEHAPNVSLLSKASRPIRYQLWEYFVWIVLEFKPNWETVYYALLGIQKIALQFGLHASTKLKNALEKCAFQPVVASAQNEQQQQQIKMNHLFGRQVELAIYWFVEHVITRSDLNTFRNAPVKMSKDCLSVRCAHHQKYYNVHSKFTVSDSAPHVYYYEVTLITGGPMRIGWNCNVKRSCRGTKLGWDKFSIAYDGYNRKILYLSGDERVEHFLIEPGSDDKEEPVQRWRAGDIVGCLIELRPDNDFFDFYLNGKKIKYESDKCFKFHSKYRKSFQASATLFTGQQCFFNFGQIKFQHKLKENPQHFYAACKENITNYQLERWSDSATNHNAKKENEIKVYADDKQILFDNVIAKWLSDTAQKVSDITFNEIALIQKPKKKQHKAVKQVHRMCQSVLNLVDDSVTVNLYEFDVNFYQVMMPIALDVQMLNELALKMLNTFEYCLQQQSIWSAKYLECKLRSMCLMLALVLHNTNWTDANLNNDYSNVAKLFYVLNHLVENCENQEVVLYALKCIEMLPLNKMEIDNLTVERLRGTLSHLQKQQSLWYNCKCIKTKSTHRDENIDGRLKKLKDSLLDDEELPDKIANDKTDKFFCPKCNGSTNDDPMTSLECRVGFCADFCMTHLEHSNSDEDSADSFQEYYSTKMDSLQVSSFHDKNKVFNQSITSGLNRSFDGAMAYSIGRTNKAGVYYYEAHLFTSGPVIVGWTTLNKKLSPDKDISGMDVYRGKEWLREEIEKEACKMDSSNTTISSSSSTKVIGCKIEISDQRTVKCVAFYLNGREIYSDNNPELANAHYHPAIYMRQHQHVCFNLGQANFKNLKYINENFKCTNPDVIKVKPFCDSDKNRYKFDVREIEGKKKKSKKLLPTSSTEQNSAPLSVLDQILTNQIALSELNDAGVLQLMRKIVKSPQSGSSTNKVDVLVGLLVKNMTIQNYDPIKNFIEKLMAESEARAFDNNISIVLLALQKIKPEFSNGKTDHMDTIEVNILPHVLMTLKKGKKPWALLCALYCLAEIWKLNKLRSILMINNNEKEMTIKQKVLAPIEQLAEEFEKTHFRKQLIDPSTAVWAQVGLCAQHFLRLSKQTNTGSIPKWTESPILVPFVVKMDADADIESIVLSNDGFCARNYDCLTNVYVRSSWPIDTSGVHYFETILLTSGAFQVGWSSLDGLGTEFVLNLQTKKMCVNGDEASVEDFPIWNVGDIVGCMVDIMIGVENKITVNDYFFYLNGVKIAHPLALTAKRYYIETSHTQLLPFVGLGIYQQCHANFGQHPFKNETYQMLAPPKNEISAMQKLQTSMNSVDLAETNHNNLCIGCCKQAGVYRMQSCDHMVCLDCSSAQVICYICDKQALVLIDTVDNNHNDVTDFVPASGSSVAIVNGSDYDEGLSYLLD